MASASRLAWGEVEAAFEEMVSGGESDDPAQDDPYAAREQYPDDAGGRAVVGGQVAWQATWPRAKALIETVNVPNHIVNWGLMTLYYLWMPNADRSTTSFEAARGRWRDQLADYDLDPVEWDRQYYRQMLIGHSSQCGTNRARDFGSKLVRYGYLRPIDVDIALPRDSGEL